MSKFAPGATFRPDIAPSRPEVPAAHLDSAGYRRLALGLLLFTIYGSWLPFHFRPETIPEALEKFQHISLTSPGDLEARGDWNITFVLFAILGFAFVGMFSVDGPRRRALVAAPLVFLGGCFLSVFIEFSQIFFPPRTVSLNDLVIQASGACFGACIWVAAGQRITRWIRRLGSAINLEGLARRVWPGYLVLLVVVQLMPFDFTVSAAELARKWDEGRIHLVPFESFLTQSPSQILIKVLVQTACFAPLGALRAVGRGRPRPAASRKPAFVFGLAVTALVELLRVLVYSRVFDATDIVLGTAAVVIGSQAGELFRSFWNDFTAASQPPQDCFHPSTGIALGVVWLATILFLHWSPFDFTTDPADFGADSEQIIRHGLHRITWWPFADYYWGSKYNALDQFLRKSASFVPLGIIVAVFRGNWDRKKGARLTLLLAILTGMMIEIGKYFLPSRHPSTTDPLLECLAAWLAFTFTEHVRMVLWADRTLFGPLRRFE